MDRTLLLIIAALLKNSLVFGMQPTLLDYIKLQIAHLKAENVSQEMIAIKMNDSLRQLLDWPLQRVRLDIYMGIYKTLIENGADKNLKHVNGGKTALMDAALGGRPDFVQALLNLGVDTEITDNSGKTAMDQMNASLLFIESSKEEIMLLLDVAKKYRKQKLY